MKFKRLLSTFAAAALLFSFGELAGLPAQAAALEKVPFTINNNSGIQDAPLFVGIMGTNPATGRDAYLVQQGNDWVLQDIPHAAPFPAPPQPLNGVMFAGPAAGSSLTVLTPHIDSGRLYYSWGEPLKFDFVQNDLGKDKIVYPDHKNEPSRSILHGSAEYTYDENNVLWYNSTQVDFFGPPAQVGIADESGHILSTGRLALDGFDYVHTELAKHGEWSKLVEWGPYNNVVRVLNPSHKLGHDGFNAGNMQPYIDQVWEKYKNTDMRIRPIGDDPNLVFTGRVGSDNVFRFTTPDSRFGDVAINKPTPWEALACAGPMTGGAEQGWIARTLCAGFNRSNMMTYEDHPTTNDKFYADSQWRNWYVKIVHEAMATGHAYAFAFDDVGGYESLTAVGNPSHAYLQLDPFSGSVEPIGEEPDGSGHGGDNGGGDNGGDDGSNPGGDDGSNPGGGDDGSNPGGGDDGSNPGGGDDGSNPGGGDDGSNPGGGDDGSNPGGGDDGDGGDGGNPGGGDDGENPGGGDDGGDNGDNPGGDQSPGGNGDDGADTDKDTRNPPGSITLGTMLSASVNVSPERPTGKRQWHTKNVQVSAQGVAPAGTAATLQIKVGKAAWATYAGPVTLKKAGKTRVQARVIAGNRVSPVDSLRVKLDKKAPTKLKAKTNKRGIKLRAKDKTSKVAKIRYRIKRAGGGWTKWRAYKGKRIKARANFQRIRVRAIDTAGNKRVKTFKVKARR
ncbi:Beta-1,3-glucanase [Micrococcales bacterium KH10]|nr:Beta-1,3-glucanase [Micrococcales bacterium KH10]